MKKQIAVLGLAALLPVMTNGQTNWSSTHPDVVALQTTPMTLATAESVLTLASNVFNLAGIPAPEKTNAAGKALRAYMTKTAASAQAYPQGTNRAQVYVGALAWLAGSPFSGYGGRHAVASSNQCLERCVVNYLVAGQTNAAQQARNKLMVDAVTGVGVGSFVLAQLGLGNAGSALNAAEASLTNGTMVVSAAYETQRKLLLGTGFGVAVFQRPTQWDRYMQQLPGSAARLRSLVAYCLTNFPAVEQGQCDAAKLQLMWLRVEAGNSTNKVTQLRRLLREVARITPVNGSTAEFIGWLRGFHRSLTFSMPDDSDPTAFNYHPQDGRLRLDERMDTAATLAGVTPPYRNSVWGERWKRGLTPEEAQEFAEMRGQ